MAKDLRTLENEINQLQIQFERNKRETERIRRNLVSENRRELDEYQERMITTLDSHDANVQNTYENLLKKYRDSVDRTIQNEQLKMDMQYQKLLADTEEKERKLLEKSQEIKKLTENLRQSTENKARVSKEEANKYMTETALLYKEVEKTPHEKFYPHRLNSFYTAICEGRTLYKAGLFEATIAIAISARTGLSRLKFDINESYENWQRQYYLWKTRTGLLHLQLTDEVKTWFDEVNSLNLKTLDKELKKKLSIEINYWSYGEYGYISNEIAEMGKEIGKAQKMGETAYLKTASGIDSEKMGEYIKKLDNLTERFNKMKILYKNRYRASCLRSEWGEKIITFFEDELNLVWMDNIGGFRAVEAERSSKADYFRYMEIKYGKDYSKVDTRDWLELVFENSTGTRIMLYIVPYEKDTNVENRFILYIDFSGSENLEYARQIYAHIVEVLNIENGEEIVTFTDNVSDLTLNSNTELRATGKLIEKRIRERKV